ncbi:hypothetical protein IAT38_004469 [Cryptococcus sp. DSM 104549]
MDVNMEGSSPPGSPSRNTKQAPTENPPTILSSKFYHKVLAKPAYGSMAWNEDGQCLCLSQNSVTVLTPHIPPSSTAPPPVLIDPKLSGLIAMRSGARVDPLSDAEPEDGATSRSARGGRGGRGGRGKRGAGKSHETRDARAAREAREAREARDAKEARDAEAEGFPVKGWKGKNREKFRRPLGGEVRWWATEVAVAAEAGREEVYNWRDPLISNMDQGLIVTTELETEVYQAVWSPSGLNEMGGCLLVMLSSTLQLSVYAPSSNPATMKWTEIADLTQMTQSLLLPRNPETGIDPMHMLHMRTTCISWSKALPLRSMIGIDGSLLATSDRVGRLLFWNHGSDKVFHRQTVIEPGLQTDGSQWVTSLAWSEWTELGPDSCGAYLAMGMTDGSVKTIHVVQKVVITPQGKYWQTFPQQVVSAERPDKRAIGALTWVNDVLVWTKPGSVHMFAGDWATSVEWKGRKNVRLERVGNWAGANGLTPCIGIHLLNRDTLQIVLSSLTAHLITSFATSPTSASTVESLEVALPMRKMFVDTMFSNPTFELASVWGGLRLGTEGWTAHTTGWDTVGKWGSVGVWATEAVPFHNLDMNFDSTRYISVVLANLGQAVPPPEDTVIEALRGVLREPPPLLRSAPHRTLMPYLFYINSSTSPEAFAAELLDLIQSNNDHPADLHPPSPDWMAGLWKNRALDSLRLRYVLASWCTAALPSSANDSQAIATTLRHLIQRYLIALSIQWAIATMPTSSAQPAGSARSSLDSLDLAFLRALIKAARRAGEPSAANGASISSARAAEMDQRGLSDLSGVSDLSAMVEELEASGASGENGLAGLSADEECPACSAGVGEDGKCEKGHEWERCVITHTLIVDIDYRVCSTCSAPSLLPARHRSPPIPVGRQYESLDWKRFNQAPRREQDAGGRPTGAMGSSGQSGEGGSSAPSGGARAVSGGEQAGPDSASPGSANENWRIDALLEGAIACPVCGGRWRRA